MSKEKPAVGEYTKFLHRAVPKSDMYLITLRNRVNREIARRMGERGGKPESF